MKGGSRLLLIAMVGLALVALTAALVVTLTPKGPPPTPRFEILAGTLQSTCTLGREMASIDLANNAAVTYIPNAISCSVTAIFRNQGGDGSAVAVFHAPMFHWMYPGGVGVRIVTSPGPDATCDTVIPRTLHGDVVAAKCSLEAQPSAYNLLPVPLKDVSVTYR